ncbi:hypothetical protein HYS28_01410 [Candidatus Uhrbacteria bacterium]|nr:hypothetical protein [Candidatus Uhrbacteria bacterium]
MHIVRGIGAFIVVIGSFFAGAFIVWQESAPTIAAYQAHSASTERIARECIENSERLGGLADEASQLAADSLARYIACQEEQGN